MDRPSNGLPLRSRQLSNVFVVLGDMLVCERRVIRRFATDEEEEKEERRTTQHAKSRYKRKRLRIDIIDKKK